MVITSMSDRAAAVLGRHSAAAMPVSAFVEELRDSGTVVSEGVLLRALAEHPRRFRVVTARPSTLTNGAYAATGTNTRAPRPTAGSDRRWFPWEEAHWVVPAPSEVHGRALVRPGLRCLRTALVALGWEVDASSTADRARWLGMILEMDRFQDRLCHGDDSESVGSPAP